MEFVAKELIGRDAAGEKNGFDLWIFGGGALEFFDEDIDGGLLEASGKVGDLLLAEMVFELVRRGCDREIELFLNGAQDSSFDAAE